MSGFGQVYAVPSTKPLRGWQWTTAVAGVLTMLAARSWLGYVGGLLLGFADAGFSTWKSNSG